MNKPTRPIKPVIAGEGGHVEQSEVVTAQLEEYLSRRYEIATTKKEAEAVLKALDDEIKVYMIQHGTTEFRRPEDGLRMKIIAGKNNTISHKKLVSRLAERGWRPEEIIEFLVGVTDTVEYDYVDMRVTKDKE